MNNQEAIDLLNQEKVPMVLNGENNEQLVIAHIKAIEALEKQIPKKAIKTGNMCPVCHSYLASEPVGDHCCFNCGQAIDWSVEK